MKLPVATKITMIILYWQLSKIFSSADNWGLRVNNILAWTLAMYR